MSIETQPRKQFRWVQVVIAIFTLRRTWKGAVIWALVFGIFVGAKAAGYAAAYPSEKGRQQIAATLSGNPGFSALLGRAVHADTIAGFTTWNCLGVMAIIGSIWAILTATRTFRGEEENGRWEMLLTGQTTQLRATLSTLAGLLGSLLILLIPTALIFIGIGKLHTVQFDAQAAIFFAVAGISGAAMFLAVGALTSQLMPTRTRAASTAVAIFGVFFLIRALADISVDNRWLLNITPLGWIEKLRPLYGSQPIWLVPIATFISVVGLTAVLFAHKRDLGDSLFADHDTAKPRTSLLGTPLGLAFRLTRSKSLTWIIAALVISSAFGYMTKPATQLISDSTNASHITTELAHTAQTNAALTFLSIIFLMLMLVIMAYTTGAIGALREDEAQGYIDNLLVQRVGRLQWLGGRLILTLITTVALGIVAASAIWLVASHVVSGITYHELLTAGLNALAPACFVFGLVVCTFGFIPRATSALGYAAVAWSFVLQIISSGVNLNHWILDTSILHHMTLAPASSINWTPVYILVGLGFVFTIVGMARFTHRDLVNE